MVGKDEPERRCTMAGAKPCPREPCHDLPVCSTHLAKYARENPVAFIRLRVGRVMQATARMSERLVRIRVAREPGDELRGDGWREWWVPCTWIRLAPGDAEILADWLVDAGDQPGAVEIQKAVARVRGKPVRHGRVESAPVDKIPERPRSPQLCLDLDDPA